MPEFDLAEGLTRLMGNRGLYRKLLVNFATQYAQADTDIRNALDSGDYARAHELVHAVKGVAGNLAAKHLQQRSAELEKLIKHADPGSPPPAGELNPVFYAFRDALNRALEALACLKVPSAGETETSAQPAPWSIPPALAKEATARLREAAELGDISGLAEICSELVAASEAFVPIQARVTQLAEDFDFDGVLNLLEELEKSHS